MPKNQWDEAAAAHLLRRAGFGGTPADAAALHELGLDRAVDSLLSFDAGADAPAAPVLPAVVREPLRRVAAGEDRAALRARLEAERRSHREIRLWWLERLVASPRPLEEKMTLFWHGHFTSGAREVKRSTFMLQQNEMLRRHALGSFRTLLLEVSRDPAMLVYLDNARNVRRQPNENYARELLELFTLGEGAYTEADVKAAARAFTGWSLGPEGEFRFRRAAHDGGEKTFLGRTGAWDGGDVIDILLEHPACSRHLARRLLTFFVKPAPEKRLVEALAAEIRAQGYELRPVLRALFRSRAFYAPSARGALIKSPVELIVGTARTLGTPLRDLPAAERALAALGQELMQPPSVRGWPGDRHWINTATLMQRYNFVAGLVYGIEREARGPDAAPSDEPDEPSGGAMTASAPATRSRLDGADQPPCDPRKLLAGDEPRTAEAWVDSLMRVLLVAPLSAEKRAALIEYAGEPPLDPDDAPRLRRLIHLICSTPEYQTY